MDEEITHTLKKLGELIMNNQTNENLQTLVATLKVTGVPALMYPLIGDDMSDGAIITEDNQTEYTAPFKRFEGECELVGLEAELMELSASELTLTKEFTSEEEAEEYVKGLSSVAIYDNVLNGIIYNAQVVEVEYDIFD